MFKKDTAQQLKNCLKKKIFSTSRIVQEPVEVKNKNTNQVLLYQKEKLKVLCSLFLYLIEPKALKKKSGLGDHVWGFT